MDVMKLLWKLSALKSSPWLSHTPTSLPSFYILTGPALYNRHLHHALTHTHSHTHTHIRLISGWGCLRQLVLWRCWAQSYQAGVVSVLGAHVCIYQLQFHPRSSGPESLVDTHRKAADSRTGREENKQPLLDQAHRENCRGSSKTSEVNWFSFVAICSCPYVEAASF